MAGQAQRVDEPRGCYNYLPFLSSLRIRSLFTFGNRRGGSSKDKRKDPGRRHAERDPEKTQPNTPYVPRNARVSFLDTATPRIMKRANEVL
jgi:hypothetical protein